MDRSRPSETNVEHFVPANLTSQFSPFEGSIFFRLINAKTAN